MRIEAEVDPGLCCGFGNCIEICPQAFKLDEASNRAKFVETKLDDDMAGLIREAMQQCPTQAIRIVANEEKQN